MVEEAPNGAELIERAIVTSAVHGSQDWPIAAAMLQFTDTTWSGRRAVDAPPAEWRAQLLQFRHEGFTDFELANKWLDLTRLDVPGRSALRDICAELGLRIPGYVITGRPLSDDGRRAENLSYTHASLDVAAEFGVQTVCLGLHPFAPRKPGAPLWFWTDQSSDYDDNADRHAFLVTGFRELAQHAQDLGMKIAIEMYPGTDVGTADRAVRLVTDIGHPAAGINPDLGNLVRVQEHVDEWQDVVVKVLPVANYWHVKNYARAENPFTETVFTTPSRLEDGVVDYRKALRYALSIGFAGTIVTEHYGGDGIAVSAYNRDYLRRLLATILEEPVPAA